MLEVALPGHLSEFLGFPQCNPRGSLSRGTFPRDSLSSKVCVLSHSAELDTF